ncbi:MULTISPECIES: restriction endonuclease subunit S [Bacteroidales]|nr:MULTISPECIES: restriction endonuclease subunit S [Bacteroidales]
MRDFKEARLIDITIGNGTYGIAAPAVPKDNNKYTYLRITDINDDGSLNFSNLKSVDDPKANKYLLKPNDIVFARTGNSTGRSYFYDGSAGELVYAGFLIKFSLDSHKVNPKILKYYTHSKNYYDWVASFDSGATRGNINAKTFAEMPITLPPRNIQDKIVAILSALDEKIETNRKINARLEELAQAIFKSWFIDFEPFGGKMPTDWELKSLSGIANYLNGLAMQKYSPINNHDKLPVLKIKELGEGRINDNSDFCSKANIGSDYIIENGDIIFSWSGTLLVKIWTGGKCGLNQHLFKVTSNQYPKWFYYFWTLHHNAEFKRIAKDKAVTMGHIKREELDKALVSVPPLDIMHRISGIMDPIFNQLISTNLESARLSALRDTLLPKLMSGELIPE